MLPPSSDATEAGRKPLALTRRREVRSRRIWSNSARDAFPFAVTMLQLALNIWLAATWNERSLPELASLWLVCTFLFWYNPIIATHNFLHTPWFASAVANNVYAAINSINLGLPQILYRFHHLNHHRYENDRTGTDGRTRDHSSTYAHGRSGAHERVALYGAVSLFRRGTAEAYYAVLRKGQRRQLDF